VRMLGFRRDVPAVFGAADVVAVPSTDLEAFSYTALEGLAGGRPVIGSRIGAIPEIITEDVGYLTPPGDAEGIARAIVELASDVDKRTKMGKEALQRANRFTLDACVEGTEKVYTTLKQKLPLHSLNGHKKS
jgi:glycosyltransferase involved in cell wall biosynthesis